MALSRDGGKTGGKSRWARESVQPVNSGANANIGAGMSTGSGSKGSLSQLTRKTHKGTGSKGSLRSLLAGTRKTGKTPFPSMGKARRGRLR
jgi:hypothetical protein